MTEELDPGELWRARSSRRTPYGAELVVASLYFDEFGLMWLEVGEVGGEGAAIQLSMADALGLGEALDHWRQQ